MIVWTRWGIAVFLLFGLGVGTGFILDSIVNPGSANEPLTGIMVGIVIAAAGGYKYLFNRYVLSRHLDKPRVATASMKLDEPVRHENGIVQTHRIIQLTDPSTGQPVVVKPRSTFFFLPVGAFVVVLPIIGLIAIIANTIELTTR